MPQEISALTYNGRKIDLATHVEREVWTFEGALRPRHLIRTRHKSDDNVGATNAKVEMHK